MPDLPPPNWYTDPDDESQYRYWDGSVWTDYRAPRLAEAAKSWLRPVGALLSDTFSSMRRQWWGNAVVALVFILGEIVAFLLVYFSVNEILMGELSEVMQRASEPGFDPSTPANKAYFESLEFDRSWVNFVPGVAGVLVFWITGNIFAATVALLTLGDLRGRSMRLGEVLRTAFTRLPRLMGLDLQILLLGAVVVGLNVAAAIWATPLLILLIPLSIVAVLLTLAITYLAYVVASAGPPRMSLLYARRLIRGRFWGVFGRIALFAGFIAAVNLAYNVFGVVLGGSGGLSWSNELIYLLLATFVAMLASIATAIIYHDLGGESD